MEKFTHTPDFADKRILLIRTDKLGDAFVTSPSIRALLEFYPSAHFDFLASHRNYEIFTYAPAIKHTYVYNKTKWMGILPLVFQLRKAKYDVVLNFNSGSKSSSFFCSLIPAPVKIACWGAPSPYEKTYTHVLTSSKNEKHYTVQMANLMEDMGIQVQDYSFYFPVPQKIIQAMEARYPKQKANRFCFLLGNITAERYLWATEKYARLAELVLSHYPDTEIFFMVGKGEESLLERITLDKSSYQVFYGGNLHESGAFFTSCDLVIATSTGAAHLASAMGCTLCSILTQYQADCWRPLGPDDFYICPDTEEPDIHSIQPEDVFAKIHAYWQTNV